MRYHRLHAHVARDASADKHMDHCGVDATPVVGPLKTVLGC